MALVTGAARRIGRAVALALAEAGFDLALHYNRSGAEARALAAEIAARGRRAVTLPARLDDPRAAGELVRRCVDALGPPGVLVNNASRFLSDHDRGFDPALWRAQLAVDLDAPVALALALAEALPEDAGGLVVNLLDARILAPTDRFLAYTVAKAGLWAATRVLARRLAPRVRVCAIAPDLVLPAEDSDAGAFRRLVAASPLGRPTAPEEVAGAVRFLLATPSATGLLITLDSGRRGGPLLP
ncbi:3-oxoacyl-[acyl-carrier-protein] reductase [bacterium HR39]|nr:3-oxoacyl-[acyl-carrier-protein] reductase [bacterium HR39]